MHPTGLLTTDLKSSFLHGSGGNMITPSNHDLMLREMQERQARDARERQAHQRESERNLQLTVQSGNPYFSLPYAPDMGPMSSMLHPNLDPAFKQPFSDIYKSRGDVMGNKPNPDGMLGLHLNGPSLNNSMGKLATPGMSNASRSELPETLLVRRISNHGLTVWCPILALTWAALLRILWCRSDSRWLPYDNTHDHSAIYNKRMFLNLGHFCPVFEWCRAGGMQIWDVFWSLFLLEWCIETTNNWNILKKLQLVVVTDEEFVLWYRARPAAFGGASFLAYSALVLVLVCSL